jgi:hypothetical protein
MIPARITFVPRPGQDDLDVVDRVPGSDFGVGIANFSRFLDGAGLKRHQ